MSVLEIKINKHADAEKVSSFKNVLDNQKAQAVIKENRKKVEAEYLLMEEVE